MKKIFNILLLQFLVFSYSFCQTKTTTDAKSEIINGHPAWIMQGNIYEVNVRQYTEEGTLNAFAKHLDRLKEMGVQTLWFMPINPISKLDRKGSLGSYYAVSDYTALNPEFGTIADFKQMVQSIHKKGMKVIIDWVPNHTGADHRWLTEQPDFFVKDSTGKAAMAVDWADTRQLNYKNPVMQDSMIAAMKYWVSNTDIDGFRCDVAWNVPASFWRKCIPQLKNMKSIFMLAEGDSAYLPESGFDAVYPWHMFKMMEKVAKGERPAFGLDSIKRENDNMYPANTIQMYFTSNHDENSWNKADYGTFPGAVHAPFAVFTQTMANSVPLIYGGQEEPVLRALKFFDKDPMTFHQLQRSGFYKTLLHLRKRNAALSADASFRKVSVGDEKAVYAFVREKGGKKVFVILNLSAKEQLITIKDKTLLGNAYNVFMGIKEPLSSKGWNIEPWGYVVYEYNSQTPGIIKKDIQTEAIGSTYKPDKRSDTNNSIVYFSFDNGISWVNRSRGLPKDVSLSDIAVSDKHVAVSTKQNGIFLFDFQDHYWVRLVTNPPNEHLDVLYFHQNKIFVGTQNSGIFLSKDLGKTWSPQNDGLSNMTIRKLVAIDNKLYVGTNGGLFSFDEKENKWHLEYGDKLLQVNGMTELAGENYIATNRGVYKTSKYFRNWKLVMPNRSLHNIGSDGQTVYAMVYNELFFSYDKGLTWRSMQKGLPAQLYSFQVMKKDGVILVGQWDGVYKRAASENSKAAWEFSGKGLPKKFAVTEMKIYKNIVVIGGSESILRKGMTTNK